jgi:protein-disulfide isomerase
MRRIDLDKWLSRLLAVVVMLLAGVKFWDMRHHTPAQLPSQFSGKFQYEPAWKDLRKIGVSSRDTTSPVQLVEIADFECPFCKQFEGFFRAVDSMYPGKINRIFVHYPLSNHRFAYRTARMAECADKQHRFWQMHDILFAEQDSFGLKPWSEYAHTAKIPDTVLFTACVQSTDSLPRISQGLATQSSFRVLGTPTVWVNGCRFPVPPTKELLRDVVSQVLIGKSPTVAGQSCSIGG